MSTCCCKKSPRSICSRNILNHFCRAYKKNVIRYLHSRVDSSLVIYRSYDDKAYLCPDTSTSMQSTRSQSIYQSVENPTGFGHYNFPEKMVCVTPATFLDMTKQLNENEKGEEVILTTSFDGVCQIKPKFFVGSGNDVWASHLIDNRHSEPHLHLIDPTSCQTSVKLRDSIKGRGEGSRGQIRIFLHFSICYSPGYPLFKMGSLAF